MTQPAERGSKGDQGNKGDIGDRGFKGDRGTIGDRGNIGERGTKGEVGLVGDQGIRGPKGEAGHDGDVGRQGEQGRVGDPGFRGEQGEVGAVGPQGAPADPRKTRNNTQRLIYLYVVSMVLFALLAWRSEGNHRAAVTAQRQAAAAARQVAAANYAICLSGNRSLGKLNATFDALAQVERTNPYTGGAITTRRIKIYADAKFALISCGTKP